MRIALLIIGVSILGGLISCETPASNQNLSESQGSVNFQFSQLPISISTVNGTLSSSSETYTFSFSETNDTTISFTSIPTGNYSILIDAFEDEVQTWTGSSSVVIKANETSDVNVAMTRLRGNGEIVISFDSIPGSHFIASFGPNNIVKEFDVNGVFIRDLGSGDNPGWANNKSQFFIRNGSNINVYNSITENFVHRYRTNASLQNPVYMEATSQFVSSWSGQTQKFIVINPDSSTTEIQKIYSIYEPTVNAVNDWIYFTSAKNGPLYDIYRMKTDGSREETVLADPQFRFLEISMSYDGTYLVGIRQDPTFTFWWIFVHNLETEVTIYNSASSIGIAGFDKISITPDNQFIIFKNRENNDYYRMTINGSDVTRLTTLGNGLSYARTF